MLERFVATVVLLLASLAIAAQPHANPASSVTGEHMEAVFPLAETEWMEGPASLPKGAKMAVLEGDPNKEGLYVFRLKLPDGYRVPPHTHPKTERVTVIAGTFNLGMGEKFNADATRPLPTGTYGYWPAGMKHFVWVKGETIIQFHGIGPWSIKYINPADDPRNQ